MRKAIISLAALSLAGFASAALPTIPLFTAAKAEMYKYAYPENGSKVEAPLQGKNRSLNYTLKGDVWSGGGIGVDKQRAADYVEAGALEFYVRGAKGGEKADVGFVQAKGLDEKKDLAFQVLLPITNYGKITTAWTKVTIPLKDFPKEGSRWIESENRRAAGAFNWNRVSEFVIGREPGLAEPVGISFANVAIVGSYDPKALEAGKPKAEAPKGSVTFYADAFSADGGGAYAYPAAAKVAEVAGGHASKMALKASLITTAWSGGGIYRAPLNLTSFKDKGVLELWAKGGKGGEEVYIGLVGKSNGMTVRLSSNSYLPGGLKTEWQKVTIPLSDYPANGAHWDEATQKNLNAPFDWASVSEVMFDNNGANNNNAAIFFDDVVIKDKP